MAEDQTGYIHLPDNTGKFSIVLMNWYNDRLKATGEGNVPVEVKAGHYDIVDIRLYRTDSAGDVWSTRAILPVGLKIKPGETATLQGVNGPTRAFVRASSWATGFYSFSFTMEDKANYRYAYFRKNDRILPDPGFVIEDAEGNNLFQGNFEPG